MLAGHVEPEPAREPQPIGQPWSRSPDDYPMPNDFEGEVNWAEIDPGLAKMPIQDRSG